LIHQFDSHRRQLTELFVCETDSDFYVTAGRTQSVPKGVNSSRHNRGRLPGMQKSYSPFSWLLRAQAQRPRRRRAADQPDERAPLHCPSQFSMRAFKRGPGVVANYPDVGC
jgi:hypothetical protein